MDINSQNLQNQIQYMMFNVYFPLDCDYYIFWCSQVCPTLLSPPKHHHVTAYPILCYYEVGRPWPYYMRSQQLSFRACSCLHTAPLTIIAQKLSFQFSKSPTKRDVPPLSTQWPQFSLALWIPMLSEMALHHLEFLAAFPQ